MFCSSSIWVLKLCSPLSIRSWWQSWRAWSLLSTRRRQLSSRKMMMLWMSSTKVLEQNKVLEAESHEHKMQSMNARIDAVLLECDIGCARWVEDCGREHINTLMKTWTPIQWCQVSKLTSKCWFASAKCNIGWTLLVMFVTFGQSANHLLVEPSSG